MKKVMLVVVSTLGFAGLMAQSDNLEQNECSANTSVNVESQEIGNTEDGKNMNMFKNANKKIEKTVVGCYKTIENAFVSTYQRIEDTTVGAYKKVEDSVVKTFLDEENINK